MNKTIKRIQQDKGFLIQDYYNNIIPFTSQTYFLDLSIQQANSIINLYQQKNKIRNNFTNQDYKILKNLQKKIKSKLKQKKFGDFFIRLSLRSPKDGFPYKSKGISGLYTNQIQSMKSKYQNGVSQIQQANIKLCAYFRVMQLVLKCKNEKDAINLLITSSRVFSDLLAVKQYIKEVKDAKWDIKICLRKWNNKMNGQLQFRCFVKNNKMRAISQYNHYIIIKALQSEQNCKKIKKIIYNYWLTLRSNIQYIKDYVIDFAVLDLAKSEICVIELNPYCKTTGPSLFLWEEPELNQQDWQDKQQNILFRKRTQILHNIMPLAEMKDQQFVQFESQQNYEEFINKIAKQKNIQIQKEKCVIF